MCFSVPLKAVYFVNLQCLFILNILFKSILLSFLKLSGETIRWSPPKRRNPRSRWGLSFGCQLAPPPFWSCPRRPFERQPLEVTQKPILCSSDLNRHSTNINHQPKIKKTSNKLISNIQQTKIQKQHPPTTFSKNQENPTNSHLQHLWCFRFGDTLGPSYPQGSKASSPKMRSWKLASLAPRREAAWLTWKSRVANGLAF